MLIVADYFKMLNEDVLNLNAKCEWNCLWYAKFLKRQNPEDQATFNGTGRENLFVYLL